MSARLVAGVDSSTQSCTVVVRDADTGDLVRKGRAPHPDGTEVDPAAWEAALGKAITAAGGLDDVEAIAVGGQQHGMVCLDESTPATSRALIALPRCARSASPGTVLTARSPARTQGAHAQTLIRSQAHSSHSLAALGQRFAQTL